MPCWNEGLRHDKSGRRRDAHRNHPSLRLLGSAHLQLPTACQLDPLGPPAIQVWSPRPRCPAHLRGSGRKVCSVPTSRVVAGCDGRARTRLRPHPRRHDGQGGSRARREGGSAILLRCRCELLDSTALLSYSLLDWSLYSLPCSSASSRRLRAEENPRLLDRLSDR